MNLKARLVTSVIAAAALAAGLFVSLGGADLEAQNRKDYSIVNDDTGHVALGLAIRKLAVSGTFMQAPAHPDDETNALFALYTHGMGLRSIDLQNNRGEGGQNEIGPELFHDMGVLRTAELLSAHRIDGAEQYFTRAIDYGYSFDPAGSHHEVGPRRHRRRLRPVDSHAAARRRADDEHPGRRRRSGARGDDGARARSVPRGGRSVAAIRSSCSRACGPGRRRSCISRAAAADEGARAGVRQVARAAAAERHPAARRPGAVVPAPEAHAANASSAGRRCRACLRTATTHVARVDTSRMTRCSAARMPRSAATPRSNHKCQGIGGNVPPLPGGAGRGGGPGGGGPAAAAYTLMDTTIAGEMDKDETSLFDGIDTRIAGLRATPGRTRPRRSRLPWPPSPTRRSAPSRHSTPATTPARPPRSKRASPPCARCAGSWPRWASATRRATNSTSASKPRNATTRTPCSRRTSSRFRRCPTTAW